MPMPMFRRGPRAVAGLLPATLLLLAAAGCSRCGAAKAPVVTELAAIEADWLKPGPGQVPDVPQVEAITNKAGTGGVLVVRTSSGARLVHGTVASPGHPSIDQVVLSPDGRRLAYVVGVAGQARLVLDGKEGPAFEGIDRPAFSGDGKHIAYAAKLGDTWRVVVDQVPGPAAATVPAGPLPAKDGSSFVAVETALGPGTASVVTYRPDLQRTVLKALTAEQVFLSEDASTAAAVVALEGGKKVLSFSLAAPEVVQEGPVFEELSPVTFDPTGTKLAYAGRLGDRLVLVAGGRSEPLPAPSLVEAPVFNPVTGAVGTVVVAEKAFLHLAFDPKAPKQPAYDGVVDVTFSPDGSRTAYAVEDQGRGFVVVNGAPGPVFDRVVGPRFSPDGKRLVYRARQDGKRFVVIADADGKVLRQLAEHDQVLQPAFGADGVSLAYAVVDDTRLRWVVEPIDAPR